MPKAKWGAGDNPLTADDINSAEVTEPRIRYSGPVPPGGTYRWTIGSLKKDVSAKGNDKVVVRLELDGSWRPNHKTFDGAPVWHHLALTKPNAPNVRNFLDSIGASSDDLLNKTVTDEAGYITKLGAVGDPSGIQVFATVKRSRMTSEYPDPRLEVDFGGYIMVTEDDGDAAGPAAGSDDEPPF